MRTVEWDYTQNKVNLIDQRLLPGELRILSLNNYFEVAAAIKEMVVRGAPAIGATAAFGMAIAAHQSDARNTKEFQSDLKEASEILGSTRPTAVNLVWAINKINLILLNADLTVEELRIAVLEEAQRIADEDVIINRRMAEFGAKLIDDGDTIIHHCNTGALAAVDWGTALGVIRMAHSQGKKIHVLVGETRPRLQGARLTAWELEQYSIPYDIITDSAAGYFLQSKEVNKVIFGADRVAANGDIANKIGTYPLAVTSCENGVPTYAVVPFSTIDFSIYSGWDIPIEERDPEEVLDLKFRSMPIAPERATARNPAFDVTPNKYITAIVTESGVIYPPFSENLKHAFRENSIG